MRKLWNFVYKWGESRVLRLFCVADEAHRLAYPKSPIDSILREARKYGVGMILTSQSPHDFDPIVFGNVATKICFRCPTRRTRSSWRNRWAANLHRYRISHKTLKR